MFFLHQWTSNAPHGQPRIVTTLMTNCCSVCLKSFWTKTRIWPLAGNRSSSCVRRRFCVSVPRRRPSPTLRKSAKPSTDSRSICWTFYWRNWVRVVRWTVTRSWSSRVASSRNRSRTCFDGISRSTWRVTPAARQKPSSRRTPVCSSCSANRAGRDARWLVLSPVSRPLPANVQQSVPKRLKRAACGHQKIVFYCMQKLLFCFLQLLFRVAWEICSRSGKFCGEKYCVYKSIKQNIQTHSKHNLLDTSLYV